LGFIGMTDPLREGVKDSIALCHRAGIRVCMITGDHPVTASAIAVELGIATAEDQAVTGRQLDAMDPQAIEQAMKDHNVFARVAPQQKLVLVKAAQALGHFVAVTGDGVNDAPALRAANIGVAMGKSGTDVARDAAELVVSDDDFSSIVGGVEEGRVAYDNVRKVVAQLTATGAAEVMLVCLALAAGGLIALFSTPLGEGATGVLLPLLPAQLLWLNLVTNGIQGVALAFEPSEGDVLSRQPRPPEEPIFNRLMIERTLVAASVMATVSFAVFLWTIRAGWEPLAASNVLLLLMVLFENIHVGNNRSETKSALAFSPLRSPYLLAGVLAALAIHVLAMNLPILQRVLRTEPVSLQTWATLLLLALSVFVAMELHKWSWAKRYGTATSRVS
jgi:P-type Ca2+ transporter type 2C